MTSPTKQEPVRRDCLSAESITEFTEQMDEVIAYFAKEIDYEVENMGAGGSQIALGRWRRFSNVLHDAKAAALTSATVSTLQATVAERDARVAEMRELLQEAYDYGTIWRGDRIYKYVTEPPSPGEAKEQL